MPETLLPLRPLAARPLHARRRRSVFALPCARRRAAVHPLAPWRRGSLSSPGSTPPTCARTRTWWYLRFLLPAAPAIVAGGPARPAAQSWPRPPRRSTRPARRGASPPRSPLSLSARPVEPTDLHALSIGEERAAVRTRRPTGCSRTCPRDAVCLTMQASGALFYYTDVHVHPLGCSSTRAMSGGSRPPSAAPGGRSTPCSSRSRSQDVGRPREGDARPLERGRQGGRRHHLAARL